MSMKRKEEQSELDVSKKIKLEEPSQEEPSRKEDISSKEEISPSGELISHLKCDSWLTILKDEFKKPYFENLTKILEQKFSKEIVYPSMDKIFAALDACPFASVRVVILGQDPYFNGNATGLCFSVPNGVTINPSLENIFKEVYADAKKCKDRKNGDLSGWAKQGVLLLNTILTVEKGKPMSHKDIGWEKFTGDIIRKVNVLREHVVFILWGSASREKSNFINKSKHLVLESGHPSPLSCNKFFGNHHFSKCNEFLKKYGYDQIDWDA